MTRIGTAGWNVPRESEAFPSGGSRLERYAARFSCVEINSTFYRSHRASTFERWSRSVPEQFAFSVKLPKAITHERRLVDCTEQLDRFLAETAALGEKRAVILAQFPPSLAFDATVAGAFFASFRDRYADRIACEPRHASWFTEAGDALVRSFDVTRAATDPAIVPQAAEPGGAQTWAYYRWHGSPRTYISSYDDACLATLAASLARARDVWCVFDNTTLGAATDNALTLERYVSGTPPGGRTEAV